MAKNELFRIFFKKIKNPALNFRAFGRKDNWLGNFDKILKIFDENAMEKLKFYLFWKSCC